MSEILTFNDTQSRSLFPNRPFSTRHNLCDHPLLQLSALAELARKMDPANLEYAAAGLKPNQLPEDVCLLDLAPETVIEQIETCGAWMALKNVEGIPEYRELLETVLLEGARQAGYDSLEAAGMVDIQGFIFVASAHSVTPFHADNEDNLFVHLHGRKFFHVIENEDRTIVTDADLEAYPGKHRNLKYRPEFEKRAIVYDMEPGDGIFLPFNWPHWVETGDDYSISMQFTWRSPKIARMNNLMVANALLRTVHLPQPAPGRYPFWDKIKISGYSMLRKLAAPLRHNQTLRRFIQRTFFGRHKDYYYGS